MKTKLLASKRGTLDMYPYLSHSCSSDEKLFDQTKILTKCSDKSLLHRWVMETVQAKVKYQLLWQGTRDTFAASAFHSKCNGKGPTVSVIVSNNGKIFGGYTSESWGYGGSSGAYKYDATAFIYSLTHKAKCATQKNTSYSIWDRSDCGPTFGGGNDIWIYDNCNTYTDNYCNPNHGDSSYALPPGADNTFLAGSYNFTVTEIEVYQVIKQ